MYARHDLILPKLTVSKTNVEPRVSGCSRIMRLAKRRVSTEFWFQAAMSSMLLGHDPIGLAYYLKRA